MLSELLLLATMSNFRHAEITRTIDGDTLEVSIYSVPEIFSLMSVRVKGINSPEMKSSLACERKDAQKAKLRLEELIYFAPVDLMNCERDKYFRLLCDISSNGKDVAQIMVAEGHAVAYFGEAKLKYNCTKAKLRKQKLSKHKRIS